MLKTPPHIIVHSFDQEDRIAIERLLELAVKLDIPVLLGQGEWFLTKAGHEPLRLQTKPLLVHPDDFFIHASTGSGATQAAKSLSFMDAELTLLRQLVVNLEAERDAQEVTIRQDRKENEELLREVDRLKALVPAWQHLLPVGSTVAFVNDAEKRPMVITEVDQGGRRYWVKTKLGSFYYHAWSDVEPVAEHAPPVVPVVKEPLPEETRKHPQAVGGYVRRTHSYSGTPPIGEIALVQEVATNDDGDLEYVVNRPNGRGQSWWAARNCEPCDPPADAEAQDPPNDPPLDLITRAPEPST